MTEYTALYNRKTDEPVGALKSELVDQVIADWDISDKVYTKPVSKEEADAIKYSIVNRPSPGVEAILSKNK